MFVAYCRVGDINEEPRLVNPKIYGVGFSRTELLNNLFYNVYTRTRVAVLYVASNYIFASWEYTMLRVGIETNQFVFVHVREVYG